MGTPTFLGRAPRGSRRLIAKFYEDINESAADAYLQQAHKPSKVAGKTTLGHLLRRLEEFLVYLGAPYTVPPGTEDNEAILRYLWRVSRSYERTTNAKYTGDPESDILDTIESGNHKSCLVLLDSILQGIWAAKGNANPLPRPPFVNGTSETAYFVAYVDAIGSA